MWTWLILWLFKPLQLGGIIGGVAIILFMAFPSVSITWFADIVGIVVASMVFKGYYFFIEKVSVVLILLFTIFTIVAVFMLQNTDFAFALDDVIEGVRFKLPAATVGFAIAAFGLTGVGGDEIVAYNYWCLEKGYACFTGPYEDTDEWRQRAKGVDIAFEAIGHTEEIEGVYTPIRSCIQSLRGGGKVCVLGLSDHPAPIVFKELIWKEAQIITSRVSDGEFTE